MRQAFRFRSFLLERERFLSLVAAVLLCAAGGAGCARMIPQWRAPAEVRAPDAAVAAALGDSYRGATTVFDPSSIPVVPEPTNLRPCCAFGADLKVAVGAVPVPGFSLDNIRGPEDIGPHKFNIGLFETATDEERGLIQRENNGLVYTCRGGFIDIAHIRDNADMTVYLSATLARLLESGGEIKLSDQGGQRRIVLRKIPRERIGGVGRRPMSLAMAQWLAYQISVWHEIATWYGYATIPTWPEKVSAFSPEDLYSNLIGIKLASGIVSLRDTGDEADYNRAMNAWMAMALKRLETVSRQQALDAMRAVDGIWWTSQVRLPDFKLVLRRDFEIGPLVEPWLIEQAYAPARAPDVGCANAGPELILRIPSGVEGVRFDEDVTLEIEVSDAVAANGFPFPRAKSRTVTPRDFPAIIERIRREHSAELGPLSDQPQR
ncbi:MAG TPA: DUF4056 domain-containing protein [Candidatus Binatia bacterium]|nr:DUF4056 domain-containing protein [Candidatus Binatia bacterium]